jgi:hypothetical protein
MGYNVIQENNILNQKVTGLLRKNNQFKHMSRLVEPKHRIVFFSREDMTVANNLINAEKFLNAYTSNEKFSINDLLEIYNIKLYFENDLYLLRWTEETKSYYKEIIELNWKSLKEKLVKINDDNIERTLNDLEYNFKENFWCLLNQLGLFKKISNLKFEEILKNCKYHLKYILKQKGIVEKFDKQIRNYLIAYEETAELILSKLEQKQRFKETCKFIFPKSLTLTDKENIINIYLDNPEANLNYVRLVENCIDSPELKLSAKTRLKAKKKSKELNNQISENGTSWSIRVQVSLSKNQLEPATYINNEEGFEAIYSESFLNSIKYDVTLFFVFKKLFLYTDDRNLITLISKNIEFDGLETIFIKSKNAYETGEVFTKKDFLSSLQLIIFEEYLNRKNNSIENLISSFIEYLNDYIAPNKLIFKIHNSNISYVEKIRNIAPEYDFLLKQYQTYVEEGEIDIELIQINSNPIRYSEICSLSKKKYIYMEDNLVLRLKYLFYSNQSYLFYVEPFNYKYNSLYDLLMNENVKIDTFQNYQQDEINKLIDEGYLKIDPQEYIKINTEILIYIIGEFHRNEVISYWNYDKIVRDELDKMIEDKLVKVENTLLTIQEKKYFNYFLNKKEFTNGLDLRNKYLHGTNSFSEIEHKRDYYTLLKIIILTLLKIEDDILIHKR